MNNFEHVNAARICHLMRRHNWTISTLAWHMKISQTRVRFVRENGVRGYINACDWIQAITGKNIFCSDAV